MKKFLLYLLVTGCSFVAVAQEESEQSDTSWKKMYRETATRINDLVHTKLDAKFDYANSRLNGKVWITLKPHFYSTDSLELDAKGMTIQKVALVKGSSTSPLKFDYDGMMLNIRLNKSYKADESYTIYIEYVAKPDEYTGKGSAAITDAKGLYFINPRGEEKDKPTQIWTQGETEGTSVWCPTIDRPNQKSTQETIMTVPEKYVTLSNGKLVSQKKNADGTRTDSWKMDLPHAPYLFFMGVGDFAVVKDNYKGKEVSYYVEKEYAPVARKIFGNTPEMIAFFSKVLGVEYPWVKYSQMVGRDYVSGAMENTTATLHQESAQQDARELVDGNTWEGTIAHELFHQWFGDLVTSESWSNLTVNESFANYSQVLWNEHKYGKDAGAEENFNDMQGYFQSMSDKKDLVRFYYEDKEAMFDAVSYNKGGRILNMLRNYVGDSAFYKSLNLYLTANKFKAAESHNLRLAFEEVTGKDMNWFWNQWYFGSGHPKLSVDYVYDDNAKTVSVIVKQTQSSNKLFRLPVAIDIYNGTNKKRHSVWVENAVDTFTFAYTSRPDLVNFDGDKVLLAEKKDNKTLDNYVYQFKNAGTYMDRREAIDFASKNQDNPKAVEILKSSLKDKYHGLRTYALTKLDLKKEAVKTEMEPLILAISKSDPKPTTKATAIGLLGSYSNPEYKELFVKNLNDSSYTVSGFALESLTKVDKEAGLAATKKLITTPAKGKLMGTMATVLIQSGDEGSFDAIAKYFDDLPLSMTKISMLQPMSDYLTKIKDTDKLKKGVDLIVEFRQQVEKYGYAPVIDNMLKSVAAKKETAKAAATDKAPLQTQIDYIKSKIGDQRKSF
ncbi:M1 family aminopeptidase [Flavitalea sp.]|nr:M1 family metallopeptidase [Flavitalea sp.]